MLFSTNAATHQEPFLEHRTRGAKGERGIKKCNRCNVRPFPCFCLTNISFLHLSPPNLTTVCENGYNGINSFFENCQNRKDVFIIAI